MSMSGERYQPPLALVELTAEEQAQLCERVGLRWDEVRATMMTPTQMLLDHLAAQGRIVQAVQQIAWQRELAIAESELAELERHLQGIDAERSGYG